MSQQQSVKEHYDYLDNENPIIVQFLQITNKSPEKLRSAGIKDRNFFKYDAKHSLLFEAITESKITYSSEKSCSSIKYRIIFAIGFVLKENFFKPYLSRLGSCHDIKYFMDSFFDDNEIKIPTQIKDLAESGNYIFLENGVDDIRQSVYNAGLNDYRFGYLAKPFILHIEKLELTSEDKEKIKELIEKDISIAKKLQDEAMKANMKLLEYLSTRGGSIANLEKLLESLTFENI